MQAVEKSKAELVTEIAHLRQRVAELEQAETERKQMEDELRKSEERFRQFFENELEYCYMISPEGEILDMNNSALNVLGYKKEEIIGKPLQRIYAPESLPKMKQLFARWKKTGQLKDEEMVIITKKGDRRTVLLSAGVVKDTNGKILQSISVQKDITERKQAEEMLLESVENYRELADNITDVFFAMDKELRYTYWNKASENLTGIPAKDALGKSLYEIFPEVKGTTADEVYREVLKTQHPQIVEQPYQVGDKNIIFEISVYPLKDGLSVFVKDITERKQAEQERLANVHFLESMDRVNRAIQGTNDLEQMMKDVLDVVLSIFDCDRAYLAYPCDPDAAMWQVPMECAKLEYPGIQELGLEMPMDAETAERIRLSLASDGCMKDGPGTPYPVPAVLARRFQIKCSMILPIHPKLGKPWQFGIQQCSYARTWTAEEERLFQEIGHRLADGLTSLLVYRDLQENEERFRAVFEGAPDAIFLADPESGTIIDANPAASHLLLRPHEEIVGLHQSQVHPSRLQEQLKELFVEDIQQFKRGKELRPVESVVMRSDGSEVPVEILGHMVFIHGKPGLLGTFRDITERKQADEALKKSEEKYRLLSENIPVVVYSALPDEYSTDLFLSGQFLELTGYPTEQFLKEPKLWTSILHPEDRDYVEEKVQERRRTRDIHDLEYRIITKYNKVKWIRDRAKAVLDEHGEIIRINGFMEDVTERKQAEQALRASEEKYRSLVESSEDSIYLIDLNCNYIFLNNRHLTRLGVQSDQVIGRSYEEFHSPKESKDFAQRVKTVVKTGQSLFYEYQSQRDNRYFIRTLSPVTSPDGDEIKAITVISKDITERKLAEEALYKSNEMLRVMLEAAPVAIFDLDTTGRVQHVWNPAAERLLGWSRQEVIGRFLPSVPEDGKEEFRGFRDRIRLGKSLEGVDVRRQRKDGSPIDYSIYAAPLYDVDGKVSGNIAVLVDITERQQTQQALLESENRFRLLVEHSVDAFILHDVDGRILDVNQHACDSLGYTREELLGLYVYDIDQNVTPGRHMEIWEKMVPGEPITLEGVHRRKDGTTFPVEVRLGFFESGGRKLILGLVRDVTERKEAEDALRESEERFRAIFETAQDLIFIKDSDLKFTAINPAMERYYGVSVSEMFGKTGNALLGKKVGGRSAEEDLRVLGGVIVDEEHSFQVQGNTVVQNIVKVPIRNSAGEIIGLCGIARDITDRKQAEEKLREREAFNYALFHYNPIETIVVDREGRVTAFNRAKETSGDRLPTIGDRMYKDYAGKHEIDMRGELMKCISSGKRKKFLDRKYGDRHLTITISPFAEGAIIISEDITERKRAEEALQESEQFSSSLLNNSPHPIIVINPDTSIRYVNPALEKLTGFSTTELLNRKAPYPWWSEEIVSETTKSLKRTMQQGAQRIENKFCTKNGEPFWVEITAEPLMDDGKTRYLLTNWIDITERKRAEDLLQKERDTFYSILDRAPYGVMVVDAEGNHTFVNSEFTNITGYTLGDIPTTQEWSHRAYPDQHYRNMVMETWEDYYAQGKDEETFRKRFGRAFARTFNVMCKDGANKEIEIRTSRLGNESTIVMLSDVTDRKRMHDLLETAAAEWRTTFDAISDAVCLLDPQGKIIRCNNAMLKLVGKPLSNITNHHCWEVMHGVSEAPHSCPITLAGKTNHRETEVMFKDARWLNISIDPLLNDNGNFIGGVHIMSDITDRMRIQNELQDSREQLRNLTVHLESVREQERTNIAREIHDELAQTLTALRMDVSWLDRRLPADAQSLSEKTESMGNLIDSTIQTVKRISAELRPGVLDDLGLVAAIEWQAEEFQNRTGIRCRVTVDPDDIAVDQDLATAIFRIFQETLTNVARHARATRVAVNLKKRAGKLTLRVRDNGIGITEEQISGSQSFGLIGMQERVVPWDGKISFKGIPDKGTTVTVSVGLDQGKKNRDNN